MNNKVIHISSVGDCLKKFKYGLEDAPKSPTHILSLRGTINHSLIEQTLRFGSIEDDSKECLLGSRSATVNDELFEQGVKASEKMVPNMDEWINSSKLIDLDSSPSMEERLSFEYKGFIVTGQLDYHDGDSIVDFKSGKNLMQAYKIQVAGYHWLLEQIKGKHDRECYVVLLGTEPCTERHIPNKDIPALKEEFVSLLDNEVNKRTKLIEGEYVNCRPNITKDLIKCSFCEFRGICSGV